MFVSKTSRSSPWSNRDKFGPKYYFETPLRRECTCSSRMWQGGCGTRAVSVSVSSDDAYRYNRGSILILQSRYFNFITRPRRTFDHQGSTSIGSKYTTSPQDSKHRLYPEYRGVEHHSRDKIGHCYCDVLPHSESLVARKSLADNAV